MLGALLFLSFPPIIGLATTGYTDVPSVALSAWTIYFFVLALEKDKRYHLVAWPVLTLTVLMRFTGFLLVVPIVPILVARASILRSLKEIALGICASLAMSLPALAFYFARFGDPIFPFTQAFFAASDPPQMESFAMSRDLAWFFINMKSFVLPAGLQLLYPFALTVVGIGIFISLFRLAKKADRDLNHSLFLLLISAFYVLVFFEAGFAVRQITLVVLGTVLYHYFGKADQKSVTLHVIFLLWFMTYFDFHSHDPIKIERYFVVMAPGVAFFTLEGLHTLISLSRKRTVAAILGASLLIGLAVLVAASLRTALADPPQKDPLVADAIETSRWLKRADPGISEAKIYSDLWPLFSWYLKQKVDPMPFFKDQRAFNHELEKQNVDYYLTIRNRRIPSYEMVTQIGAVAVFKKNLSRFSPRRRILYLGMNWEHYLEEILDFKYFVEHEPGRYYIGKGLYVDAYGLEELRRFPLVVLYNFRWHDRKAAESLLREYVESGGRLIVDASGNKLSMPYNLEGDTFLGVSVVRRQLPAEPEVKFTDGFRVSDLDFRPFLSGGRSWYGMTYENLDKDVPFRVLATANGQTLIAEQKMGRGKVIWLGFNLVWHSFYKKNDAEQKLIQRLVDYALQESS
jgi:hypothetical protein